ncbi:MAG: alpha/beta hydrolase [Casimicrobiaceae bacterium]
MKLEVAGSAVYAYTGARAWADTQPVMVFVHGAAHDHSVWALQSRYFAHHGANVLALDLPGHGRSDGAALSSIEALAAWLVAVLDAQQVSQATLVGHSMGALAVLECAARHPRRVARLALLGPAVPMEVSDDLLAAAGDDVGLAYALINGWSFGPRGTIGGNALPGVWMVGNGLRLMERNAEGVLAIDLRACRDYTAGLAAAAAVTCPTLVIVAGRDLMAPARTARALLDALPRRDLVRLEAAGHALMAEEPDAVLDALRTFVTAAR